MATCFYGAELLNDVRTFVFEGFFVLFSFDSFKYKMPYNWGKKKFVWNKNGYGSSLKAHSEAIFTFIAEFCRINRLQ